MTNTLAFRYMVKFMAVKKFFITGPKGLIHSTSFSCALRMGQMSLSLVCRFVSRACLLVTYDADEYATVFKTQTLTHFKGAPLLMFHRATLKQTRVELIRVEGAPYVSMPRHTSLLR
jgi:hypothetical protein